MLLSKVFREPALIAALLVPALGACFVGCRERVVEVEKRQVNVVEEPRPVGPLRERGIHINVDVKPPADRPVAP